MALLFVPAGVGVMAHLGRLTDEWLPVSVAGAGRAAARSAAGTSSTPCASPSTPSAVLLPLGVWLVRAVS